MILITDNYLKVKLKIVFPFHCGFHLPLKTMADVAPITPKKGEYMGLCSAVAILDLCVLSEKMGQVMSELRRGVVTCLQLPESPLDLSHKTRHWEGGLWTGEEGLPRKIAGSHDPST